MEITSDELKALHEKLTNERKLIEQEKYKATVDYETKLNLYNTKVEEKNKSANEILSKLGINRKIDVTNQKQINDVQSYCEKQIKLLSDTLGDDITKIREETNGKQTKI